MAEARARTAAHADRTWQLVFFAAVGLTVLGFAAAIVALVTDDWVLDVNPCGSPRDHPIFWVSTILLGGAWVASLALLARGICRTHTPTLAFAASMLVTLLFVSPLSLLLMGAGYGWRCPLL